MDERTYAESCIRRLYVARQLQGIRINLISFRRIQNRITLLSIEPASARHRVNHPQDKNLVDTMTQSVFALITDGKSFTWKQEARNESLPNSSGHGCVSHGWRNQAVLVGPDS